MGHALLAGGGEGVDEGAAQQHAVRALGEQAHHVQAGADAGIRQDGQVALQGAGGDGQGWGGGKRTTELAVIVEYEESIYAPNFTGSKIATPLSFADTAPIQKIRD